MKIIHLNLQESSTDLDDLKEKLKALSVDIGFLNDLRFCPHLICFTNPETETMTADNVNDGYLESLKKEHTIIRCRDLDELVVSVAEARENMVTDTGHSNALF